MATTMEDHAFDTPRAASARRGRTASGIEYRTLYAVVFAVCFVMAALLRLLPRHLHPWIGSTERPMSLAAEARAATDATVPYVFQVS